MITAAAMLGVASCSDFNDYNETPVDSRAEGNMSLWQNISANPNLSGFAKLAERTGLSAELDNTKSYTVWAPKDGTYDLAALEQLPDSLLKAQFMLNHIAEYRHQAIGNVSERIRTLNDKKYDFKGTTGSYTFCDVPVATVNLPSNNGTMHILENVAPFRRNIYEYLIGGESVDSLLRDQFLRYEYSYLDETNSVKGPMVDGVQTYIDSVVVTYNTLANSLGRLANEDSTYTFLFPTDAAFTDMYNRVAKTYNYIEKTVVSDIMNYDKIKGTAVKTASIANYAQLKDSLSRYYVTRYLAYSNNDLYNQRWLQGNSFEDTVRATNTTVMASPSPYSSKSFRTSCLSNGEEIFKSYMVGEQIELSNGYGRVVDSLAFRSWESFCPEIVVLPRTVYNNRGVKIFPSDGLDVQSKASVSQYLLDSIFGANHGITDNFNYLSVVATGGYTKPDIFIKLPDVQSTKYNFYVVYLPQAMAELGGNEKPNCLNYELDYCDKNGKKQTKVFSLAAAQAILDGTTVPADPKTLNEASAFKNDPSKLDTVFIGQFEFPVCYKGLSNDSYDYTPTLHISNPMNMYVASQKNKYNRDVRIAAIILRPVELDEYNAKK